MAFAASHSKQNYLVAVPRPAAAVMVLVVALASFMSLMSRREGMRLTLVVHAPGAGPD